MEQQPMEAMVLKSICCPKWDSMWFMARQPAKQTENATRYESATMRMSHAMRPAGSSIAHIPIRSGA